MKTEAVVEMLAWLKQDLLSREFYGSTGEIIQYSFEALADRYPELKVNDGQ